MPSTFTSNLGLEKPAPGEQDNAWGDTINENMDRLDAASSWRVAAVVDAAQGVASLPIPAWARRIKVEFQGCAAPGAASLYVRLSFDGGATFASGSSDYFFAAQGITNQNVAEPAGGAFQALVLTPGALDASTLAVFGDLDMDVGRRSCLWRVHGGETNGTVLTTTGGGWCNVPGTLTHILFGFVLTSMTAGRFRLLASAF